MSLIPLSELPKKAEAKIVEIVTNQKFGALDELVGRRLTDSGFSEGMPLTVISKGLLGNGPYAVRLGNQSQFALRGAEANKVMCRVEASK